MKNVIGAGILLTDDFNNVLILKKGKKKDLNCKWQIVGRAKKGKETIEKCISNSVKEDLNTLIFDLEEVKLFDVSDESSVMLYSGKLKDFMNHGKNVLASEWIGKAQIDEYDLTEESRNILLDYFGDK